MDPSEETTSGAFLQRKVTITNPQGFHMRPMRAFVELAVQFGSQVRVSREGLNEPVDGKSILSLMLLGAERGTELVIEAEGADAAAALASLVDLLANLDAKEGAEAPH